jgi:hypothetical protein
MWRSAAGHNVQLDNADDDDWETDPDFVVSFFESFLESISASVI